MNLTASYILVLPLWHLSISDGSLSSSQFLSSFNILAVSCRILLEGVVPLTVCFADIFEDDILFLLALYRWRCNNHFMFLFHQTSGLDETMIDFLTADYVVNLIIHCHCFCQIFRIKSFVSLSIDVKIDKMLLTIIWNTTSITNNTIVTGMLFDLFSILAFQYPVKNTSNLFLILSRTVLTSL